MKYYSISAIAPYHDGYHLGEQTGGKQNNIHISDIHIAFIKLYQSQPPGFIFHCYICLMHVWYSEDLHINGQRKETLGPLNSLSKSYK